MNFYYAFTNNLMHSSIAVLGTFTLLCVLRVVALKTGLVDVPNARKIHENSVPLIGGLALFIMAATLLSLTKAVDPFSFYLVIASGMVVFVGLLDDLYQLSALWRFLIQILASLMVVYFAQVQLITFGFLLLPEWEANLGYLAIPITIFGVVGVINALNMADGVDGLAAMTFCLPVLVLIGISGQNPFSQWLLYFVICIFVFVLFNKSKKYKVFLGDNGSMLLGFILAWILVYFSQGESPVIKPVTALYLVALPVYDTIFVMLKRMLTGKSPFKPDNTHLHHLFLAQGWSQTKVLLSMVLSQAVLVFLGILFLKIELAEYYQFYLFVFMSALYYICINKIWKITTNKRIDL